MSIASDLDVLQRLEDYLGELYGTIAEKLKDDEEASAVFARLAYEESGHAQLVAYQRRIVDQNPTLFRNLSIDVGEIYRLGARAKKLHDHAASLSTDEALERALELESSAAEQHLQAAERQSVPEFASFLERLAGADEEHRTRIENLMRERRSRSGG